MSNPPRSSWSLLLPVTLTLFVLLTGALEAWFGRPELFGDDISYLDVANLLRQGDWRAALNPLWSIGYPLLLTIVSPARNPSIRAELACVFCLNLTLYLATYCAFLWFIRQVLHFHRGASAETAVRNSRLIPLAAALIFVNVQVCIGRVSSIGPDQLVTCLFFLASGMLLRLLLDPCTRNAALLGAVLGLGFLAKAIFLPLAFLFAACAVLGTRRPLRLLPLPSTFLLVAAPYCAALSWALGRPTIGEASSLNYAFHVNHLAYWMGWQGGPAEQGFPVHPLPLTHTNPPVFLFPEPFHVTYPPNYALVYWYEGYRHFFHPANAVLALAHNLHALEAVLHENASLTVAILLCAAIFFYTDRHYALSGLLKNWPCVLPALLALAVYLQVHLEGRYIAGFLAVLAMLPFLTMELSRLSPTRRVLLLFLLLTGSLGNLTIHLQAPLRLALHATDTESTPQWKLARTLQQLGLHPGDRVASVSNQNVMRCTWAYAARLHIVAAVGNDALDPQSQDPDLERFFADAQTQKQTLALFRQIQVRAVIAPDLPPSISPAGPWQHIPGTTSWVLPLDPANPSPSAPPIP